MGTVTESIWSNGTYTVPMAEVSYFENMLDDYSKSHKQIRIIFKHSRWDDKDQCFQPSLCLTDSMSESFKKDWCNYRLKLEGIAYNPFPSNEEIELWAMRTYKEHEEARWFEPLKLAAMWMRDLIKSNIVGIERGLDIKEALKENKNTSKLKWKTLRILEEYQVEGKKQNKISIT